MSTRQTSTRFTVGTLLRHALDAGVPVRLLIQGIWLEGVPLAADEMGVLIETADAQVLIRLEAIMVVSLQRADVGDVMGDAAPSAREAYPSPRLPTEDHQDNNLVAYS